MNNLFSKRRDSTNRRRESIITKRRESINMLADQGRRRRAVSVSLDWDNIIKAGGTLSQVKQMAHEFDRPKVTFCTGSTYVGTWNTLNMSGYGTYELPYGVIYEGDMMDGMFHGEGTLTYPLDKQKVKGVWDKGRLFKFQYEYADGLTYSAPWNYCYFPDRRFYPVEYVEGLRPADKENRTAHLPTRKIRAGCYDVGDGYYHPNTRCVTNPGDSKDVLRSLDDVKEIVDDARFFFCRTTTMQEHKTILERCRKAWDEPTGYRPDLYQLWFSGRRKELNDLDKSSSSSSSSTSSSSETLGESTDTGTTTTTTSVYTYVSDGRYEDADDITEDSADGDK